MATATAFTAAQGIGKTLSRGRTVLVTAIYPAHPYGRERPSVVAHKIWSISTSTGLADPKPARSMSQAPISFHGVHHVGVLVQDLERSLEFYCGMLGLQLNPDRPNDKLPYGGAWLWIGAEMIHLMELPNPDPLDERPSHGGRDRHCCVGVAAIGPLEERLSAAGVPFTRSNSGRPAIFFRDPDMNTLECVETEPWR